MAAVCTHLGRLPGSERSTSSTFLDADVAQVVRDSGGWCLKFVRPYIQQETHDAEEMQRSPGLHTAGICSPFSSEIFYTGYHVQPAGPIVTDSSKPMEQRQRDFLKGAREREIHMRRKETRALLDIDKPR